MRLIVTRPQEDAETLSDKLAELGHEAIILPLMTIAARAHITIPEKLYQGLCITSANALRVLDVPHTLKALPLYTVGPQSKAEAQRRGFTHVSAHGGDVNGLAHFIQTHLKPDAGPLLYLSGAEISADLEGKLKTRGFTLDRVVAYDAVPVQIENLWQQLTSAEGVLLYSPRTAMIWTEQVQNQSCENLARAFQHFCLSANVAAKLPQPWRKKTAKHPTEGDMLALLEQSDEVD